MLLLFGLFLIPALARSQHSDTVLLSRLLQSRPDLFRVILDHPTQHEVQILYTQIDRDKNNIPHFRSYSYRLRPKHYFYPASTVKLPTAIFALEKLNSGKLSGINRDTPMFTDSAFDGQTKVRFDTSAATGQPTISQYIRKILLVSDNDAYNRLYEFIGRRELNEKIKKYGLNGTRVIRRLAVGDSGEHARHTNPQLFLRPDGTTLRTDPTTDNVDYPLQMENFLQGNAYIDGNNQLIKAPFDFSANNIYPLADQQALLKRLLFPEVYPPAERFQLSDSDYRFVYKYMSMLPTESRHPAYGPPVFYPAYCKFLFYGSDTNALINPDIRIFNKIGDSYGYMIDNAYIVDFKNKTEFLLSAVVQSNEDGIINDEKYEYTTICLPFLEHLGKLLYEYELKRPRDFRPDLSKYYFTYP